MSKDLTNVDPIIIQTVRDQILKELDDRDVREQLKKDKQREEDLKIREEYVSRMKVSPEPWMELVGISLRDSQIKIELDWNTAFVTQLRNSGFTGPDDETIVQRYVAVLARDVAEDMTIQDDGE